MIFKKKAITKLNNKKVGKVMSLDMGCGKTIIMSKQDIDNKIKKEKLKKNVDAF